MATGGSADQVVDVNLRMLPFVRATHLGSRGRVGTTPYMTTLVATRFDPR
jgi:hypothetical protein